MSTQAQFVIEKNVPMVEKTMMRKTDYPFEKMEVGDFFLVSKDMRNRTEGASSWYARKLGHKYSFRKVSADAARCWRVK